MVLHSDIDHSGLSGVGTAIVVFDEGNNKGTATAYALNLVGSGVSGTVTGGTAIVTVGAGSSPTCKSATITTDVTMTNSGEWYDTGGSVSLEAGSWRLDAVAIIRVTNAGVSGIIHRLVDSTGGTVYTQGVANVPANASQEWSLAVQPVVVTFASTVVVKQQCQDNVRAGSIIVADPAMGSAVANLGTGFTALSVTAA